MKKLLISTFLLCPFLALAGVKETGWTSTTDPATARAALGVLSSNTPAATATYATYSDNSTNANLATNAAPGGDIVTTNNGRAVFSYYSDTNLEVYFRAVALNNSVDRQEVRDWSATLQAGGIFSSLVDACFLKTNFQPAMVAGAKPYTYYGKYGTNSATAGTWDANGIYCAGTNSLIFPLTREVTNLTILVCFQQDPDYTNSGAGKRMVQIMSPPAYNNTVMFTEGANGVLVTANIYTYNNAYAGNTFALSSTAYPTNQAFNSFDSRRQTLVMSVATNGGSWSRDGCPGSNQVWTAANYPTNLNWIAFSYWYAANLGWKGNVIGWMVFDRALTWGEQTAAWEAMAHTTLAEENIVVVGDSLSFQRAGAGVYGYTNLNWPDIAFNRNKSPNRYNLFNCSVSGASTAQLHITQTNIINTLYAPHGHFKKTTEYVALGFNDNWSATDLTKATNAYTALTNLWYWAKQAGISDITAFALHSPDAAYWAMAGQSPEITAGMSNSIVEMNRLIRSKSEFYDRLIQFDLLFPSAATNVGPFLDGVHPNVYGNRMIAAEVNATRPIYALNTIVPVFSSLTTNIAVTGIGTLNITNGLIQAITP